MPANSHVRFTQPPGDARVNPKTTLNWIVQNVPCFEGTMPIEWTFAVYREAKRWRIPDSIVAAAFRMAVKLGYQFAAVPGALPPPRMDSQRHQTIRAVSDGEVARMQKYTLQVYETKFKLAELTGDVSGMEAALVAAFKILWEIAKGYAKVKQAQRPEKMVQWEEFNRAVNEAMARAQTLRSHFRRLTRDEWERLRASPTPRNMRGVTFRIVNETRLRRSRRARK